MGLLHKIDNACFNKTIEFYTTENDSAVAQAVTSTVRMKVCNDDILDGQNSDQDEEIELDDDDIEEVLSGMTRKSTLVPPTLNIFINRRNR